MRRFKTPTYIRVMNCLILTNKTILWSKRLSLGGKYSKIELIKAQIGNLVRIVVN